MFGIYSLCLLLIDSSNIIHDFIGQNELRLNVCFPITHVIVYFFNKNYLESCGDFKLLSPRIINGTVIIKFDDLIKKI